MDSIYIRAGSKSPPSPIDGKRDSFWITLSSTDSQPMLKRHDSWSTRSSCVKKSPSGLLSLSYATLRQICIALHVALVILYVSLLGVAIPHLEHRVTVPLGSASNLASSALTVLLQTFVVLYTAGLLVSTQQLALRRLLLLRQTLTATHDASQAWTGLGAAFLTLWRQKSIRAALPQTSLILIYLGIMSALHITTTSMLRFEAFNTAIQTRIQTNIAYPNVTNSVLMQESQLGRDIAVSLLNFADQLDPSTTSGLHDNTLYDVPWETYASGNASVNATTFSVACGYLEAIQVSFYTANEPSGPTGMFPEIRQNVSFKVLAERFAIHSPVPDPESVREIGWFAYHTSWTSGVLEGMAGRVVFLTIFGNLTSDSQGQVRSIVPGITNGTLHIPDSQMIACNLSVTNHTATVDVQSRQLVSSDNPSTESTSNWSVWEPPVSLVDNPQQIFPTTDPVSTQWSDMVFPMWTAGFDSPAKTWDDTNSFALPTYQDDVMQVLASRMTRTSQDGTTYHLYELENAISNIVAFIYWAETKFEYNGLSLRSNDTGSTVFDQPVVMSRLSIFMPYLALSLAMSVVLMILAIVMVRTTGDTAKVDGVGFLQVHWLLRDRPEIERLVTHVEEPSIDNLRAAGMVTVQLDEGQGRQVT